MDKKVEIQFWEDSQGRSPIVDFLDSEIRDKIALSRILKENAKHQERTYQQFFNMGKDTICPIKGSTSLYELKYKGRGNYNFRAIFIHWNNLVLLIMFHGSGSGGRITRYTKLANERANDWKLRNPKI